MQDTDSDREGIVMAIVLDGTGGARHVGWHDVDAWTPAHGRALAPTRRDVAAGSGLADVAGRGPPHARHRRSPTALRGDRRPDHPLGHSRLAPGAAPRRRRARSHEPLAPADARRRPVARPPGRAAGDRRPPGQRGWSQDDPGVDNRATQPRGAAPERGRDRPRAADRRPGLRRRDWPRRSRGGPPTRPADRRCASLPDAAACHRGSPDCRTPDVAHRRRIATPDHDRRRPAQR